MTNKLNTIIFMTMLLISSKAVALSCGDLITTDTTLTADLHCTTGYYALEIMADDITLNLNGHKISGSIDLQGVIVSGRNEVNIMGNGGVISGFWVGINSSESDMLTVQGISFYDLDAGIIVSSGNVANIKNNDFIQINSQGVSIVNYSAEKTANNNTVNNNEFFITRVGIEVCGDNSDGHKIKNNLIWKSADYGIRINRSDNNKLYNNRILDTQLTAIRIDDSSRNKVSGNSLQQGRVGLAIYAEASDACLNTGPAISRRNKFNANHAFEFETALVLGIGTTSSAQVSRNDLNRNKLYDNTLGIFFNTDAHHNNASSNAYTGTTEAISDLGEDNSY